MVAEMDQAASADRLGSAAIGAPTSGYEANDRSGIDQSNGGGERHPNGRNPLGSVRILPSPLSRMRCALCHQRSTITASTACGLGVCERCVGVLGSSQGQPRDCYDVYLLRNSGGPGGVQATEGVALGSHRVLSPPGVGGGSDGGSQTGGSDAANRMGGGHMDQASSADRFVSAAIGASTSGYEASDRSGIDQSKKVVNAIRTGEIHRDQYGSSLRLYL